MPETRTAISHKELIEILIKFHGLHEGIWQLYVEFGLAAANVQTGDGQLSPAAIVGVNKIGLTKVDAENPLAVDASKVNPR